MRQYILQRMLLPVAMVLIVVTPEATKAIRQKLGTDRPLREAMHLNFSGRPA